MRRSGNQGNVIGEYGLILGMVGILAVGGLTLLGGNVSQMLSGTARDGVAGNQAQRMVAMDFGANGYHASAPAVSNPLVTESAIQTPSAPPPSAPPAQTVSIQSIAPTVVNSTTNVNTTSAEGQTILGTYSKAQKLEDLAANAPNPETRNLLLQLAQATYYLGTAEGTWANVGGLSKRDLGLSAKYSKTQNEQDIGYLRYKLDSLIKQAQRQPSVARTPEYKTAAQ